MMRSAASTHVDRPEALQNARGLCCQHINKVTTCGAQSGVERVVGSCVWSAPKKSILNCPFKRKVELLAFTSAEVMLSRDKCRLVVLQCCTHSLNTGSGPLQVVEVSNLYPFLIHRL
jgi:hypothetical protein